MHPQEYYLAIRQNKILSFDKKKKLELEVTMLRNNSNSERNGSHVLLLLFCQHWKVINKKNDLKFDQGIKEKLAEGRWKGGGLVKHNACMLACKRV